MNKLLLFLLLITTFILTGCSDEFENFSSNLADSQYVYPDSKDVIVTMDEYNQLKSGLTEKEVWSIVGGQCTKTGTTDLGIGSKYITVTYGCNGNGSIGSNVVLMFQGGKLSTMSQVGLK